MKLELCADFVLFRSFHLCFMRNVKVINHNTQPDGTVKPVEVPGLPKYVLDS